MITAAIPLIVGNAVTLVLAQPANTVAITVLRRNDSEFIGAIDPDAVVIYQGDPDQSALDDSCANGTPYWYKDYYSLDGETWLDDGAPALTTTPASTYIDGGPDVQGILRARMDLGFRQEVLRGILPIKARADGSQGVVVLNGPPLFESPNWPICSIHVRSYVPAERAIGEDILGEEGAYSEGWLARYGFDLICWSQNPDERKSLRKSARRILQANLPVLAAYGIQKIEFSAQDTDFVEGQFPAPVYCSSFSLSCEAPDLIVASSESQVVVTVNIIATPDILNVTDTNGAC